MAGMPGLISDWGAQVTSSCLQPCMPLRNVWFTHNANHFICVMLIKNLADILNKVNSLSLGQGLHHRKESPVLWGAVQCTPQLRKHRQLNTVTLWTLMLTGSIKPGDSSNSGCSIWKESDRGFGTITVVMELCIVNSVHEDLLALLAVLVFFPYTIKHRFPYRHCK